MSLIWLSDSSPLFFYSPSPAYFAGNTKYTAQWQTSPDLTVGSTASSVNSTIHITQGPGALVLPSIYATSFTPVFTPSSNYAATLAIGTGEPESWSNGQNYSDFSDFSIQTFTIGVTCSTGQYQSESFGFKGAWVGTYYAPPGSQVQSVQIDDASPIVTYTGFAPISATGGPAPVTVGQTDYSSTLSLTSTAGASASVNFNGAAITITGVTSPSGGPYTIALDGVMVATLSSYTTVEAHGVVLYFATNLNTAQTHTLVVTATDGASTVGLVIDSWTAYGPPGGVGFVGSVHGASTTIGPGAPGAGTAIPPTTASPTTGAPSVFPSPNVPGATGSGSPNVGVIVGALLGTLAGIFLLLWLFRRKLKAAKPKEKKLDPWDEANMLQNMKNEEVHVTTVAKQRYVYPGLIAHSELKK